MRRIYGNNPPDWVIDRESDVPLNKDRNYRVGHHISDIHARGGLGLRTTRALLNLINRMEYDAVFLKAPYIYGINKRPAWFVKHLVPKWYFLPYSVDIEKFKPRSQKKHDVMLVGSVAGRYPLRVVAWNALPRFCERRGFRLLMNKRGPRPTWEAAKWEQDPQYCIRDVYADAVSSSRFFIYCGGIYGYPVQKYFEVPAGGCLSLASELRGVGKDLGFINRKTYVVVDKGSWMKELLYYHENDDEAQRIISNGRRLIQSRHSHEIRARQFVDMLEESM